MNALPRVYVVDDDEQMLRLLSRQLREEYDVMCFSAARHFLDVSSSLTPGCLILDVHMPELNGLEVQRCLAERDLHFPTIMITGLGELNIAVQAMKAGAIDFVEKPFRRETILESIRLAQHHLAPSGTRNENAELAKTRLAMLSERELQVLNGLVAGLPNKTIAYDLGISPRTVEMHRASVMRKMEAHSLSALVRLALAAGVQATA
jgi:two-component system, LuxR family, response regulator FixJ